MELRCNSLFRMDINLKCEKVEPGAAAVASQLEGSGFKSSGVQGLFFMESDDEENI